jgi:hypothetical protein
MSRKNLKAALSTPGDWISTARSIRAAMEQPAQYGLSDQSSVIRAAARALSRTHATVWHLLAALEARAVLLADLDDAQAARISPTKLSAARVLLRKYPDRLDAIAAAARDPHVTTRALSSAVDRLSAPQPNMAEQDFEAIVFDYLSRNSGALGFAVPVQVQRAQALTHVQPDFVVANQDGTVLAGIEVKAGRTLQSGPRSMLGNLMLTAHVCGSAVLIAPSSAAIDLERLSDLVRELEIAHVRVAALAFEGEPTTSLHFLS